LNYSPAAANGYR